VLAQQALACGLAEELGRALTGSVGVESDPILLPTEGIAMADGYAFPPYTFHSLLQPLLQVARLKAPGKDALVALANFFDTLAYGQEATFDRKDLVPWIWFWMVQTPIEIAFEGLVEILEKAQTMVVGK
jgi:hypothetical protein